MTAADVEAVFTLERATPEAPHWPRHDYEAILAPQPAASPLTRITLVAELDGHLAGFAVIRRLRLPISPPGPAQPPSEQVHCELESIVIAASLRERGIGLLLMNAVIKLAASTGAGHLELEVRASNQPAIGLYTRAGLSQQGRRPSYYSNPPDDALLMAISVDPTARL